MLYPGHSVVVVGSLTPYSPNRVGNLISARRPNLVIVNKKRKLTNRGLIHSGWSQGKTEGRRKKEISTYTEKTKEHESDGYTNCNWCTRYSQQRIGTWTGRFGNKMTSGDHPNYIIIEISQNTKMSHKNLRRLAVTQTPVENHQLTLVWKILK